MLGAFSLAGSIGVLLINKLGGYLYDDVSHTWPFYIALLVFTIFTALILGLVISKKLTL